MIDCTYEIIKRMLEQNEQIKESEEIFSNDFEDDIIYIKNTNDEDFMNKVTREFYTIISLNDNPTLDLAVAQPSKYKIDSTAIGTGIMCYQKTALDILKQQLEPNERIIKITVDINRASVLDLCKTTNKQRLRKIYKSISDKSIIKSDRDFIDYVCKKGVKKYDMIIGFIALGKPIYTGSIITDYMDKGCVLKNDRVIVKAEAVS